MCTCIQDFEVKILKEYPTIKRKAVTSITFPKFISLKDGQYNYYIPFIVTFQGQMKTDEMNVMLNNCPFCGEAIKR